MIDTLTLEDNNGQVFRMSDYGLLLKSFDAPEPLPKTYMQEIDGADGSLDMTDTWWRYLVDFCHGKRIKLTNSADPDYYYEGRCAASHETRKRVTDVSLELSCQPYRLSHRETVITAQVNGTASILLEAARKPVTPTITVSAEMTAEFDGYPMTLPAGSTFASLYVVTDTAKPLMLTGNGQVEIRWRDGVL